VGWHGRNYTVTCTSEFVITMMHNDGLRLVHKSSQYSHTNLNKEYFILITVASIYIISDLSKQVSQLVLVSWYTL